MIWRGRRRGGGDVFEELGEVGCARAIEVKEESWMSCRVGEGCEVDQVVVPRGVGRMISVIWGEEVCK